MFTHRKKQFVRYGLVAPSVIVLILVTFFPFIYTLNISLHYVVGRNLRHEWLWTGLQNFGLVLKDEILWDAIIRTAEFILIGISVELILGLALALLFSQNNRLNRTLRTLLLIPMVITPIVVGLMWKALYNFEGGMVNQVLATLGLPSQPWLTSQPIPFFANMPLIGPFLVEHLNAKYSFLSLIVIDIWQWTPFVMLVLISGLLAIPNEILESAKVDGASKWQQLIHIILPMLAPTILVAILLRTIDAMKVFDTVYALFGSAAEQRLMNVHIMNLALRIRNYGQGAAISILVLVVVISLSQLFAQSFYKRIGER